MPHSHRANHGILNMIAPERGMTFFGYFLCSHKESTSPWQGETNNLQWGENKLRIKAKKLLMGKK
jgi:hypothetical protein